MKVLKANRILFFLCAVVVVQGLYWGSARSMTLDESTTLHNAYLFFHSQRSALFEDIHCLFYNLISASWSSLFHFSLFGLRAFSTLVAMMNVIMISKLANKICNEKTSLLAAFFLTFTQAHVYISQMGRSYALYIFLAMASSFAYLLFLEKRTWKRGFIYYLLSYLLVTTHLVAFSLLAVQWLHFFFFTEGKTREDFKKWIVLQVSTGLSYLPVFLIIINRYNLKNDIPVIYSWVPKPTLSDLMESLVYISGVGVLLALLGVFLFCLYKKRISISPQKSIICYLLLWLFIPMTMLFIYSYLHHPIFLVRGFITSMIPFILLTAALMSANLSGKFQAVVLVTALIFSVRESIDVMTSKTEDWSLLAGIISKSPARPVFVSPGYSALPLSYYLKPACFFSSEVSRCLEANAVFAINNDEEFSKLKSNEAFWFVGYNVLEQKNNVYFEKLSATHALEISELRPSLKYAYCKRK